MENENKKRLAVLVGCNYPNTRNELHGCINDVAAMRGTLVNRFGFDPGNIQLLTDAAAAGSSSSVMPTGANIKKALGAMVDQAKPGDVLYFHYSGHGTRIPSLKPGNPFRQDEAIVPCDFNLITDVDFRQLVNRLPKGASFTILSDSCHSGGLIDKEKEQIGPSHVTEISNTSPSVSSKPKGIPFESILHHLASLTGINTSDIATHLLELFAADASLKFRLPPFELLNMFESLNPDEGILLSGCQANETSADMTNPVMTRGKACGAFSNAVQMVLKEHEADLSNRQVVMLARQVLREQGFEQHPCLYCNDENADATFLCESHISSSL
ncbi:hypothetical protein L3X38_031694 [Prunus dulcis]|uniref:Peptidase C14 caspase domain-containing protein n=1 Tax=Prunus dulcis TaxID=3755 RepID=A0AAD4VEW1_PRUDU|nr:hypothetical protein L3X38_031694 [Prunus dulcis]